MLSKKIKGICVVISIFFVFSMVGIDVAIGSLNVYYISYFYHFDSSLNTLEKMYYAGPIIALSIAIFMIISPYVENKLGERLTALIGFIMIIFSQVIVLFINNVYLLMLSFFAFGGGLGMSYFIPIRLGWKYFPKHKGKISTLNSCSQCMTSCGFILIAEKMINPYNKKPTLPKEGKDKETYFEWKDVAENFPKYIKMNILIISVVSVISLLLIFPYPENEEENGDELNDENEEDNKLLDRYSNVSKDENSKNSNIEIKPEQTENKEKNKDEEKNENKEKNKDEEKNENKEKNENEENDENTEKIKSKNETALNAIFSWRFLITIITIVLFDVFISNLKSTMRDITAKKNLDEQTVAIIASTANLIYGALSPLWGFFYDKFGFKKVMCCVSLAMIILGSCYCFIIQNVILFAIIYDIGCWLGISIYGLLPPYVHKIFGLNIGKKIYGLIYISFSFSGYIGPIINSITLNVFNLEAFDRYKCMFFGSAIFNLISFFLILFANEKEIDYDKDVCCVSKIKN